MHSSPSLRALLTNRLTGLAAIRSAGKETSIAWSFFVSSFAGSSSVVVRLVKNHRHPVMDFGADFIGVGRDERARFERRSFGTARRITPPFPEPSQAERFAAIDLEQERLLHLIREFAYDALMSRLPGCSDAVAM